MTAVEYLSGDRWLVAGPASVVQLAGEPSDALRWWPAVRAGAGAGELIGHLYADGVLGTGTALAIVCIEPSSGDRATPAVRVLAQGSATVVVETVTGEKVPVSGAGLLSWSEVLVEGAAAVYLECPTTLPAAGDLLPMPAGVVRAGAVRWQLTNRQSGGSGVVPEMSGAEPGPAPGVPARQVPVGADDATGDDPNTEGFAGRTGMTPPASALAVLAVGSSTAVQDAEVTQSVPDPDDQDIGQGDSGAADPTEEDDDAGAPGSEQPAPADGGVGDAADRNAPGRIDDHRVGAAPAATASGRPAVQASSGRLSPDNPFPPVVVPPFSPPPLPPQVEPPPLTPPPPFVPAAPSLPPIIGGPGRNDPVASDEDGAAYPGGAGDHDGHTQLAEDLPAGYRPPPMPPAPAPGEVYASMCPSGHPNAPHTGNCRVCGVPIAAAEPVLTRRPLLARIRLSTGAVVDIDRRVVIGRAPSASRVSSSDLPHLVTVPSPHQDISRSHVEVRTEDWHILITDLHSTNGTVVRAPGRPEQLLHPAQPVVAEAGWTVELGDGVSFVVESPA